MIYLWSLSQPYFVIFVTFRVNNYNSYPKQDYNSLNVDYWLYWLLTTDLFYTFVPYYSEIRFKQL